jgi:hypothetical protein
MGDRDAVESATGIMWNTQLTLPIAHGLRRRACEAERHGLPRALMLIHEFVTDKTSDDKHARNAADLDAFIKRLSHGTDRAPRSGEIRGPFLVPGAPLLVTKVSLYVGKVSRDLRSSSR